MGIWAVTASGGGMSADALSPATPSDDPSPDEDIAYLYSLLSLTQRSIFRSGVANLIGATLWTLTLVGVVVGIPLAILGIYKLATHARRSEMSPLAFAASAKKIAIFEIVIGGLGISGLIWGFIILYRVKAIRSICARHDIPA